MNVYAFISDGELVSKIIAATKFDAQWEFRKLKPDFRNKNVEVVLKGKVNKQQD